MHVVGLDHVQLAMPPGEEDAARAFYGDLLGLTEVAKPLQLVSNGGCWFEGVDTAVHLGIQQDFAPARKAHPAFRVANLESLHAILIEADVPIVADDTLPHVRRFFAYDPFGNRIEFLQDGDRYVD